MRSFIIGILLIASASGVCIEGCSKPQLRVSDSQKLTPKELETADGSCRAALHNGKLYCTLTATDSEIELIPDTWSDNYEATEWNRWLVDFDNSLFTQWLESNSGDGQETVAIRITNAKEVDAKGRFLSATTTSAADTAEGQRKFESAIQHSLERTLLHAPSMPPTKNPLKEVRFAVTFMRDDKVVPRHGKRDLGMAATVMPATGELTVYGRLKDGRSPGIQVMSDAGKGNIEMKENDEFLRRCDEIDSQQRANSAKP